MPLVLDTLESIIEAADVLKRLRSTEISAESKAVLEQMDSDLWGIVEECED